MPRSDVEEPTEADTKRAREWLEGEGADVFRIADHTPAVYQIRALALLLDEVREQARRQGREDAIRAIRAAGMTFEAIRALPFDGPEEG